MYESIDGSIVYEILTDGTCSYCRHEAKLQELPDGDVCYSSYCEHCDEYNLELKLTWIVEGEG
jgi:hypothetical protein